ncbi:MAG TPA: hypothetical protein VGM56_13010 [Byssovorax sp.]
MTLSAPAWLWLATRVPVVGIGLDALTPVGGRPLSIATLAPMAIGGFVVASLAVEAIASLVPRWRHLRFQPRGRARLETASAALAIALAGTRGYGIAKLAQSIDEPSGSVLVFVASNAACVACLLALANVLGRFGAANGVLAILVATLASSLVTSLLDHVTAAGALTTAEVACLVVAAAGVIALTVLALRARPSPHEPGEVAAYREGPKPGAPPVEVPVPACGLVAVGCAHALVGFLQDRSAESGAEALSYWLSRPMVAAALTLGIAAGLALVATRAVARPERVAELAGRARPASRAAAPRAAEGAVRAATRSTVLFVTALVALELAARALTGVRFDAFPLALATALAMDIAREARALRALGALVTVGSEVRPYALAPALAALDDAGIAAHARDRAVRSLLHVFGPYAPSELLVRPKDAERARDVLTRVLPLEVEAPDAEHAARRRDDELSPPRDGAWGACAAALLLALAALASFAPPDTAAHASRPFGPGASGPVRHASLEMVEVDDDDDPLGGEFDPKTLVPGLRVSSENAPVGVGRTALRHYLEFPLRPGESLEAAFARAKLAIAAIHVPADTRLATGRFDEYDESRDRAVPAGVRTYLLRGPAVLTEADIDDAVVAVTRDERDMQSVSVNIASGRDGAARFYAYTRAHLMRRFAIVVDHRVISAPRIVAPVSGGHMQITMGAADVGQQLENAHDLVRDLRAAASNR